MNNQDNLNQNDFNQLNQNNNPEQNDINIRPDLYKYPNKISDGMFKMILYGVIVILVIVIIFLIVSRPKPKECPCDEIEFQNKLEVSEKLNIELGKEMYYKARSVYSDFAFGTSYICDPLGTEVKDNVYYKSGNPKFKTYTDLSNYVKDTFYGNLVNTLISQNTYKSYDGNLYCVKSNRTKNIYYIDMEEITLVSSESTKLEFSVKEKYFAQDENIECVDNCKYDYKENKFIIEKKDGRFLVTEFTFPY